MSRTFKLGVLAAAVMAAAPAVQAYEAGDFIGRVGVVTVDPDSSSSNLNSNALGELDGAKVSVDSNTQLGLTVSYMFTDQIALGILGATPFKHNIEGDGSILGGAGKLAETKQLPPTITLQYFPMPSGSKFQPYVGVGVNYTNFFEEKTTQTLTDTYATLASGVDRTDIELDDSFGLAAEIGLDYMVTDNIGVNAAIWYADIDTEATINAYAGNTKADTSTIDVDIDPWVYMVGLSYKF
ncbi:outer membrane protein [Marinobacter sp. DSM 26671]|uniref:Outer membrane protein OmpW n=2 Tax=Marinobacter TaxID=2742 RepID=A0A349GKM2_9GAMM|nr:MULTISPECIES: OmpW family outer membrane protein [Marinobacter]HAP52757.1 outer membrane protein OmpW [Marinobacter adhaerens]AKV96191.1 membrane protein [Marinobacter sp. CP1]EHJ04757.1 OmpW family protein [Marinobacter manganoxydans MnI7-9]SFE17977.1 outer membrane protein [Marinobacter sp. DSM 26671]HAS77585.1 outer membrane protein OmpW [Marinobacter adhaerens]